MFYPKALWFSVYQLIDIRVSKIGGCFFFESTQFAVYNSELFKMRDLENKI